MTVKPKSNEPEFGSPNVRFTERQLQVLKLVAVGKSNKEVAKQLHISVKTVEKHRDGVYEKLRINDVVPMVHYAIRFKIVPLMEFPGL